MEESYKQLLRQRLKPVVLGGPDYEVIFALFLLCYIVMQYYDAIGCSLDVSATDKV